MNRIKEIRQKEGLSQQALAKKIGVSYRTIQNWENGVNQIKLDKAQQLANFFRVGVGYLLGYNDEEKEKQITKAKKAIIKEIQDLSDYAKNNDIAEQIDNVIQNEGLGEFLYNLKNVFFQIESKKEYSDAEKEALNRLDHEILAFIDMLFEKRLLIQKHLNDLKY
ncbi:helix-turn-helix domain-containing protein [Streptococcus sp. DTU_2020_1000888_1_SI_GRL_NUU_041A]|jgi:transcriptional regulator|uniref:helix-turn-helix domain-containing protein n=1 Tax=Streptococcus sp. DTU_2020_1000888_1_SI_GRL_NUU_041A TaxID=3077723 RepID=UPI002057737D|nr:helix-turn-helix transcriptional regulator [Streptococcus sp. DTU_2020_1000888_1_SI_GRL_NUU_041A]WNU95028.1 helix-turn-helix transcriptional regulator [Streptococcus sp. DTU_2020_1000888_1_SI_GRL_NUU_041A]DAJ48401.1 MAG TPA: helix-turn-helix domain protein [Caudoviricetes sp.]